MHAESANAAAAAAAAAAAEGGSSSSLPAAEGRGGLIRIKPVVAANVRTRPKAVGERDLPSDIGLLGGRRELLSSTSGPAARAAAYTVSGAGTSAAGAGAEGSAPRSGSRRAIASSAAGGSGGLAADASALSGVSLLDLVSLALAKPTSSSCDRGAKAATAGAGAGAGADDDDTAAGAAAEGGDGDDYDDGEDEGDSDDDDDEEEYEVDLSTIPGVIALRDMCPDLSVESAAFALTKHGGDVQAAAMYVIEGSLHEDVAMAHAARAQREEQYAAMIAAGGVGDRRRTALDPATAMLFHKQRVLRKFDETEQQSSDHTYRPDLPADLRKQKGGRKRFGLELRWRDGNPLVVRRGEKYVVMNLTPDYTPEGVAKVHSSELEFSLRGQLAEQAEMMRAEIVAKAAREGRELTEMEVKEMAGTRAGSCK